MTIEEIDKRVAELKGLKWCHRPNHAHQVEVIYETFSTIANCKNKDLPSWSEDIQDAWKLFQELPNYKLSQYNGTWWLESNDGIIIHAETAPEAICLAWIQWKESSTPTCTQTKES